MRDDGAGRATADDFAACLLGGAVGDALGAPVEFLSMPAIRARFGRRGLTDFAPAYGRLGAITDDTQMTLFTVEGLIRAQIRGNDRGVCCEEAVVWNAYQRWLWTQGDTSSKPASPDHEFLNGWLYQVPALHSRRAPGNTCLDATAGGTMGTRGRPINDSKGCGGVMRVAPAGLVRGRPGDRGAFDLGAAIAATTHGHPSGYLAAGYFAEAIARLARGDDLGTALHGACEPLEREEDAEEVLAAVEEALALAQSGARATPATIEKLGGGWVAEEAVAIAVFCALRAEGFEHGVLLAVNHGGDSDSTGSMVGNLLGLALGRRAIPERWLASLELRAEIERLARDLADARHTPSWAAYCTVIDRDGHVLQRSDDAGPERWWAEHPWMKEYPPG